MNSELRREKEEEPLSGLAAQWAIVALDDHVLVLAGHLAKAGGFEYTELGKGSQAHWCTLARVACRYFARKHFVKRGDA